MVHSVREHERGSKEPVSSLLCPLLAMNMCGVGSTDLVPGPSMGPTEGASPERVR